MSQSLHRRRRRSLITLICPLVLGAGAAVGMTVTAGAAVTTFAQFTNNGVNNFTYTNNTSSATFNAASIPVQFNYSNVMSLPTDLQGNQGATLTLSSRTNAQVQSFGSFALESINGSNGAATIVNSIVITRNAAANEGNGTRTVLLRIDFARADLSGSVNGNAATLSASSANTSLTFSSDFLDFSQTTQRDLGLSFSSVVANLTVNPNGFFDSFTAAGTGTFSADPVPTVVPEAAALAPIGGLLGVMGVAEAARRRVRRRRQLA